MAIRSIFTNILYNGLESFGKYYSSYRGYVVDNEDPEGMNRLLIQIPVVTHKSTHPSWAFPKNSFSGNNYGMQVLPSKRDIVWVEFEHGDPRFPIWSHGHFSKNQKPEEFETAQIYGFKTPKGQYVIIDDRDDQEKIIIKSAKHLVLDAGVMVLAGEQIVFQGQIVGIPRFSAGTSGSFSTAEGFSVRVSNGLITKIVT